MPKMRTLPQAVKYIRTQDNDTALTVHGLKMLVLNGTIPHVQINSKRLVDVELVLSFLCGEYTPPALKQENNIGKIRPITAGR